MYIKRHLEKEILKASKYYPVVMVSSFMVKTFFLIKLGTLTLYVWPVTRQLFFRQRPRWIVRQIEANKLPTYSLRPVADRGRGDGLSLPAA